MSQVEQNTSTRTIKLKVIDGKKPLNTTGLVDSRLFSGENHLIAKMNPETCHWALFYENGVLPQPLRQTWTSFRIMRTFLDGYFQRRNIEIKEVINI